MSMDLETEAGDVNRQDEETPPRITLAQLLSNENNILSTITDGDSETIQADTRNVIKRLLKGLPFLFLLFLRFILSYVAKFFSLLFINFFLFRIKYLFEEQVSMKSSASRRAMWTLLMYSLSLITLVYLLAPPLLGFNFVDRLAMDRFASQKYDFVYLLMLCYLTDSMLRLLVVSIKMCIFFVLSPRSAVVNNNSLSLLPNMSCLFDRVPTLTRGGIADIILSLVRRNNTRQRNSNNDLRSLDRENEVDLESGLPVHGAGRRRIVRSGSQESVNTTGSSRSQPSPPENSSFSAPDMVEQENILAFMRMKRIFALVDSFGALYRCLLPLPVWIPYFGHGAGSHALGFLYLFFKLLLLIDYVGLSSKAFAALLIDSLEFGSYSTDDEISQSGSRSCSICFDEYYRPISLNCGHIFCQHCIFEWLDHENSCPVCRAEITRDSTSQDIRNITSSNAPVLM